MLQHCGGPRRGATSVYESGVSGGNIIKRLFLLNFTTWWHRKDGAWEVKLSCHIFPCEVTWKFLFPVWFQPRIDVTVTVMRKFLINQRECGFNTCLWYTSRCAKLVAKRGGGGDRLSWRNHSYFPSAGSTTLLSQDTFVPAGCLQDLRHDVVLVLLVADVHPGKVGGHRCGFTVTVGWRTTRRWRRHTRQTIQQVRRYSWFVGFCSFSR